MKNKKLFAILTLVAFMLTMMPVMAFATTSNQIGAWVEDGAAIVGDGSKDTHDVVFGIELPELDAKERVFVFATVAGTNEVYPINTEFTRPSGSTGSQSNGYQVFSDGSQDGMWVIKFHNSEAVELDLKAVLVKDINGVVNFTDVDPDYILNKVSSGQEYTYANIAWDNDNTVKFTANVADNIVVNITEVDSNGSLRANNGVDWVKYQVKVTNNDKAVKGAEVAIAANKVGAFVSDSVVTTNARGVATFTVYASKAGSYKITAVYEGEKDDVTVGFTSAALGSVEVADVTGHFATTKNVDFVLTGTDANGNALTANQLAIELDNVNGVRDVVFTKVPENSAFDTETVYHMNDMVNGVNGQGVAQFNAGNPTLAFNTSGQLVLRVVPDVAGEYTLKVYNPVTGAGVDYVTFVAKKFTKTAKVVISYPATTYNLDANVPAAYVTRIDANGTKYTTVDGLGQFSFTGVGVENFAANYGSFSIIDDEKFLGKEIVINAVVDDCFATTTLKIADAPAYLQFTEVTTPVGTEVAVPVKSLDLAGNVAALGNGYTVAVQNVVTSAEPGAIVSVDDTTLVSGVTDFIQKGTGVIKVASNKPGTVAVNVIVTASKANGEYTYTSAGTAAQTYVAGKYFVWQNNAYRAATQVEVEGTVAEKYTRTEGADSIYLTGIATVNFGDVATPVQTSATLIIGSNIFVANGGVQTAPAAPVIIDGRTYLPIRAVGQAIGANVDYVDGVITLTLGAQKATMVPGSNVMTVGTETVTMDAAPYLAGDGHTMVPVRYAAQAFGYELGTTANADGSVATVTVFK